MIICKTFTSLPFKPERKALYIFRDTSRFNNPNTAFLSLSRLRSRIVPIHRGQCRTTVGKVNCPVRRYRGDVLLFERNDVGVVEGARIKLIGSAILVEYLNILKILFVLIPVVVVSDPPYQPFLS